MTRANASCAPMRARTILGVARSVRNPLHSRFETLEPGIRAILPAIVVAFLLTLCLGALVQTAAMRDDALESATRDIDVALRPDRRRTGFRLAGREERRDRAGGAGRALYLQAGTDRPCQQRQWPDHRQRAGDRPHPAHPRRYSRADTAADRVRRARRRDAGHAAERAGHAGLGPQPGRAARTGRRDAAGLAGARSSGTTVAAGSRCCLAQPGWFSARPPSPSSCSRAGLAPPTRIATACASASTPR